MNEELAGLIHKVKKTRSEYKRQLRKFPAWKLQDIEGAAMEIAEHELANWVMKNTDKLRSVE